MGAKLSTYHVVSNSQDVALDQFQIILPSDDPLKADVLSFPIKLVPVTKLLANIDSNPDYNCYVAASGAKVRFVCKLNKSFKGRLQCFGVGALVGVGSDMPLPTGGKMPFDRLENLREKLGLLPPVILDFVVQREQGLGPRTVVLSIDVPPFPPDVKSTTVYMYFFDEEDTVHLFTTIKRVREEDATGKAKQLSEALTSIQQRRIGALPAAPSFSETRNRSSVMSDGGTTFASQPSMVSMGGEAGAGSVASVRGTTRRPVQPSSILYAVLFAQTFAVLLLLRMYWNERQRCSEHYDAITMGAL